MKSYIVTGSSSGIGLSISLELLKKGFKVLGIDLNSPNKEVNNNCNYEHLIMDLSCISEILENEFLCKTISNYDGLVNSAGITLKMDSKIQDKIAIFEKTLNINLLAPYTISEIFFKNRKNPYKPSSIVNISSIGAVLGFPDNPSYCSSKGALEALTRSLALDYSIKNIRVNSVRPGYTETPMNLKSLTDTSKKNQRSKHTILGRWGLPHEIAKAVLFLLSEDSSYMTGSAVTVDGGWTKLGMIQ